jgi:hypothetical protein
MATSQTIYRPSWQDLHSRTKTELKKSSPASPSPQSTPKFQRMKPVSSPTMHRLSTKGDSQASPNLQRREGASVYDYVERKLVFKFLTETVSARHEEEEPTDCNKSSIFESPKMYRRFGNLEQYHS